LSGPNRIGNSGNVAGKRAILGKRQSQLPNGCMSPLNSNPAFQWPPMFESFSAGQKLNGNEMLGQINDPSQFERTGHPHRDMILFSAGSRNVIDARRVRQNPGLI
jgi:hypothetical protein